MTENTKNAKIAWRRNIFHGISVGDSVFCLISILFLIITLLSSEIAAEGTAKGLKICAKTLIPSLFPFMVVSSLIASSGAAEILGKPLATPCRILFGISAESVCALIMGVLCGFPVGTKTALILYENNKISKSEFEHMLMIVNLPSSAFLINAVGMSLFESKSFGIALYIINILSVIIVGVISKPFFKNESRRQPLPKSKKRQSGTAMFTNAITDSAISMLYVCAFVVFFSALVGCLEEILASFSAPNELSPLLFGFFELTQGVTRSALCASRYMGMLSAAAVSGWSGLSVHFQIMSICREHSLSFKPYFLSKLFCGVMNTALTAIALILFPSIC